MAANDLTSVIRLLKHEYCDEHSQSFITSMANVLDEVDLCSPTLIDVKDNYILLNFVLYFKTQIISCSTCVNYAHFSGSLEKKILSEIESYLNALRIENRIKKEELIHTNSIEAFIQKKESIALPDLSTTLETSEIFGLSHYASDYESDYDSGYSSYDD